MYLILPVWVCRNRTKKLFDSDALVTRLRAKICVIETVAGVEIGHYRGCGMSSMPQTGHFTCLKNFLENYEDKYVITYLMRWWLPPKEHAPSPSHAPILRKVTYSTIHFDPFHTRQQTFSELVLDTIYPICL